MQKHDSQIDFVLRIPYGHIIKRHELHIENVRRQNNNLL